MCFYSCFLRDKCDQWESWVHGLRPFSQAEDRWTGWWLIHCHRMTQETVSVVTVCPWVECCFYTRRTQHGVVVSHWDDEQWLQNFRMRKQIFLEFCGELAPALQLHNTFFPRPILVQKQVAVTLWKLAMPCSYWSAVDCFGEGKSTVGLIVVQVCKAVNTVTYSLEAYVIPRAN